MLKFIIKRVLLLIPTILGVIFIVCVLMELTPSDAVDMQYATASEEVKEAKREELGLNDPLLVRYYKYVRDIVTKGSLGTSISTGQPVMKELMVRFPVTLLLTFISIALGIIIGIPLGVISAVKQYTATDSIILTISMVSVSFPNFWLALLLILLFSVQLGWLPSGGITSWTGWIMPVIVTTFSCLASFVRITRSSMLEVIRQDFVRTAKAKGQKPMVITVKHVLRNALIPVITQIAGQIGALLGGALIVESIFGMPGIGQYLVSAINNRNYPAVLGGVVLLAFVYTIINLIVDVLYTVVDPRLKIEMTGSGKGRSGRKMKKALEGGA